MRMVCPANSRRRPLPLLLRTALRLMELYGALCWSCSLISSSIVHYHLGGCAGERVRRRLRLEISHRCHPHCHQSSGSRRPEGAPNYTHCTDCVLHHTRSTILASCSRKHGQDVTQTVQYCSSSSSNMHSDRNEYYYLLYLDLRPEIRSLKPHPSINKF